MQPVAVGIIVRNGEVLACQRRRTARYPLKWEFPGGKIEVNESPLEALRRELREELAIEVRDVSEFHRQEWKYPNNPSPENTDGSYRVTYFIVRSFAGEPENLAFEQFRWVRPAELRSMDILEGNREAVDLLAGRAGADRIEEI